MFSLVTGFLSKQWMPVVLVAVSVLVILMILISNGERFMSVFGYETRDTVVEKLKQRDEQVNLLAVANAKLTKDMEETRNYERVQCEIRIAGIMAEIDAKRKSEEIIDKADDARDDVLNEIAIRLSVEEKKPSTKTNHTVKKTKRVINDSDLTSEEINELSKINITMIHEAYAAIGVSI